jgi:CBS-domain-containing membrane protein
MGREVVGVVSEADLLAAEDETNRRASSIGRRRLLRKEPPVSLTAGTLMTTPAITIGPEATIPAAARLMNTHHIRRLPVVDRDGKLVGIVSRRDLLSVFLRRTPTSPTTSGRFSTRSRSPPTPRRSSWPCITEWSP